MTQNTAKKHAKTYSKKGKMGNKAEKSAGGKNIQKIIKNRRKGPRKTLFGAKIKYIASSFGNRF